MIKSCEHIRLGFYKESEDVNSIGDVLEVDAYCFLTRNYCVGYFPRGTFFGQGTKLEGRIKEYHMDKCPLVKWITLDKEVKNEPKKAPQVITIKAPS